MTADSIRKRPAQERAGFIAGLRYATTIIDGELRKLADEAASTGYSRTDDTARRAALLEARNRISLTIEVAQAVDA